jgi:hypothetical protein
VAFKGVLACPGVSAPHFDRLVVGAADQLVAMHHQGEHRSIVVIEGALACPGIGAP